MSSRANYSPTGRHSYRCQKCHKHQRHTLSEHQLSIKSFEKYAARKKAAERNRGILGWQV